MRKLLLILGVLAICGAACGQNLPPGEPQTRPEFPNDAQREAFDKARSEYAAGLYADAFATLKDLTEHSVADLGLTRFAAAAAIDSGNSAWAIEQLKPIVDAKPGSWQELMLLARAYAQSGDAADRDAALATLVDLHNSGRHPKLSALDAFLVERVDLGRDGNDKSGMDNVRANIYYSLQPWSKYHIFEFARFYDKDGRQTYQITLESDDFDQPLWSKNHPELAAKGMRMFSMDGYSPPMRNANGTITFTHATLGFFDGRPTYDVFREKVLNHKKNGTIVMGSSTTMPGVKQSTPNPPAKPPAGNLPELITPVR